MTKSTMPIITALETADAPEEASTADIRQALTVLAAAYRDVTIGRMARESTFRCLLEQVSHDERARVN